LTNANISSIEGIGILAIGCEIEEERCYGVMNYVTLTMSDNITVGDTVRFVARASGNRSCAAVYYFAFQNFYATNTTGVFDVPVTSAGTFNAVASAECCSYMKLVSKPVSVASGPAPKITTETVASLPPNRTRKIIGIAEKVELVFCYL
jgi:hypothetical protein